MSNETEEPIENTKAAVGNYLAKPQIGSESVTIYSSILSQTEQTLQDLYWLGIKPTNANKKFLYYNSDVAQNIVTTISMTIVGDGMEVMTDHEDIKNELDRFFRNLTVSKTGLRVNQADLVRYIIEDNTMWAESVWVKEIVDSPYHFVKINGGTVPRNVVSLVRIDPSSLRRVRDDVFGWVKWIQTVELPPTAPSNAWFNQDQEMLAEMSPQERAEYEKKLHEKMQKEFYADTYDPMKIMTSKDSGALQPPVTKTMQSKQIHIPDYKVKLFDLLTFAPMDTMVLDLLALKRWLIFYVKKFNENFAGPVPIVVVGNKDSRPNYGGEYNEILADAAEEAAKLRFGNSLAIPWDWDIKWQSPNSSARSITTDIEFLDKQIYNALGAPFALFESRGKELATSSTIERVWLRRIFQMRQKIADVMKELSLEYLDSVGLHIKDRLSGVTRKIVDDDFELRFAQLRGEEKSNIIREIVDMLNVGIIPEPQEARKLIDSYTDYDLDPLDDAEFIDEPEEVAIRSYRFEEKTLEEYQKDKEKEKEK